MPQDKQYRPLDGECGIQYLRNAEVKVLTAIGKLLDDDQTVFDIVTIREKMDEVMSKSSVAAAINSLTLLGVLQDPVVSTKNGFGYKLVSKQRYFTVVNLVKSADVLMTSKANYRQMVELFVQSRDLGLLINKRHITTRAKTFKEFLTTIPDLVVVTPKTEYAPQTYAFTNELRLNIRNLLKITAYFNKWRIDGINIKAPL